MEIFDQFTEVLQANVSSKYPVFTVGGLDAGKMLKINIFAANSKGKSETVTMEAFTLKAAEKQTGMCIMCIWAILFRVHNYLSFALAMPI